MSAKVDPIIAMALISQGLQLWANMADRVSQGTITDEDIAKMLALLGMELDAWQAQIDAHQAGA
jgi:hypothetical protein